MTTFTKILLLIATIFIISGCSSTNDTIATQASVGLGDIPVYEETKPAILDLEGLSLETMKEIQSLEGFEMTMTRSELMTLLRSTTQPNLHEIADSLDSFIS